MHFAMFDNFLSMFVGFLNFLIAFLKFNYQGCDILVL